MGLRTYQSPGADVVARQVALDPRVVLRLKLLPPLPLLLPLPADEPCSQGPK